MKAQFFLGLFFSLVASRGGGLFGAGPAAAASGAAPASIFGGAPAAAPAATGGDGASFWCLLVRPMEPLLKEFMN